MTTCTKCHIPYQEKASWEKQCRRFVVHACHSCVTLGHLLITPLEPEVEGVIREALDRHREGQEKDGVYDPSTDERDLFSEIEEELLDVVNYTVFQVLKIRSLRERMDVGG